MNEQDKTLAILAGVLLTSGVLDLLAGNFLFGAICAGVAAWGGRKLL